MKAIKNFNEFIKENTVKKQSIDRSRAEFLVKESENSYSHLLELAQKIELTDANANDFVKLCYDILMELIRAKIFRITSGKVMDYSNFILFCFSTIPLTSKTNYGLSSRDT